MFEYGIPEEHHIEIARDPAELFTLAISILGDLAARTNWESTDDDYLNELREDLQFSARFFDAYLQSRLKKDIDPHLLLLGAASYYLCGLPGSSIVLARRLGDDRPDLDCLGLDYLLLWLLQGDYATYFDESQGPFGEFLDGLSHWLIYFFENGGGQNNLFELSSNLRKMAYDNGSPRQLLFADVICAVVRKRYENSTWYCLPKYTDIATEQWRSVLQKKTFFREFWPAQHLLGEQDVFRGKSAIVQMPTSAGKTKAIETIIRSAFLANRTYLTVIVAPFRALCHEISNGLVKAFRNETVIVNELSDVLQPDFDISNLTGRKQILVVTPEKLLYVLRHAPELAEHIGLLIYDEGHLFDNGTRGITYELLLTSLKLVVPEDTQKVLISAVLSNADAIGNWLSGDDFEVVSGITLTPTHRTVAFASWLDRLGRLEFVTPDNPDNKEFFVPRIIEQQDLQLKGRETKKRLFPSKSDGHTIALFLGLRLAANGGVAVFCGKKSTASNLCGKIVDAYDRGLSIKKPVEYSDQSELGCLHYLYDCNLGTDAIPTQSAAIGVFAHHGNTPHGIRLAVEHAMKKGLVKFVICTSTLAQGVNLPIRYLIVTSVYYGAERIKVRDFHNLLGRAGRAGMHTEGSILFADPVVYDKRTTQGYRWRWKQVKELLEPSNSEPCGSTILSLFKPLHSDDHKSTIIMEPLSFVRAYVENLEDITSLPSKIASAHEDKGFTITGIEKQIAWRMSIIDSIESYLMSQSDEADSSLQEDDIADLAKGTLGYYLAEDEQREQIVKLFVLLAQNIQQKVTEPSRRKIFGKTLYGVWTILEIERWVTEHIEDIVSCEDYDELLSTLWSIMVENIQNTTFRKCDKPEVLEEVAVGWIHGKPFYELYEILVSANVRLIAGTQRRKYKLDQIVDICENALAYEGTLVVGAVAEFIELIHTENNSNLTNMLRILQKRLKYGLPSSATTLYELGFADRIVSIDLMSIIDSTLLDKIDVLRLVKQRNNQIAEMLSKYPAYFTERLKDLLEY